MSTASSGSKPTTGWQPPSLEEMQAMLPQYQFECLLGRGGMGAVYKALQVSLDRLVAIKVLPGDLIDDTDANFAERFKNEARTMAKMNHPSIVNVYDFGETRTGLLYIVMEFIDGTDVSKMILSQGKLPEDYALSITAHVCDALAYAHKNGVIHRDIKPANILINMDGAVKVADFGLAKANDAGQSGLTKTNMAMGTPDFVAPEALIPGIPLDGRADLYAIGVMLYQMLAGEIPRGLWTLPGQRLGTDPRFDAIITKAMQTDRDYRYQTAADLRRDLDTILVTPRAALIAQQQAAAEAAARATQSQKQSPTGKDARTAQKKSMLGPVLGIVASVILVAGLYVILTGDDGKKPVPKNDSTASTSPLPKDSSTPKPVENTPPPSSTPPAPEIATTPAPTPTPAPAEPMPATVASTTPAMAAATLAPALARPAPQPVKTTPGWTNLLATADGARDAIAAPWRLENGVLHSPLAAPAHETFTFLQTEPLLNYELRLRVSRDQPGSSMILPFVRGTEAQTVFMDGGAGFTLAGLTSTADQMAKTWFPPDGSSHELFIEVRENRVRISHDGVLQIDHTGPLTPGQTDQAYFKPDKIKGPILGIGVCSGEIIVTQAEIRVIDVVAERKAALFAAHPRIAQIESGFKTRHETDAQQPWLAAVAKLNQSYVANGIGKARAAAQTKGSLYEVTLLDAEKAAIDKGEGVPAEDATDTPASLKALRSTYRAAHAKITAERDAKAAPLYDLYLKALDAHTADLTQGNKIDEATQVKAFRDEIATQRPAIAATTPATGTQAKTSITPAPKAPPGGGSSWRTAADYLVNNGGFFTAFKNGVTVPVTKPAEIPAGRFDIIELTFERLNSVLPPAKDADFAAFNGLRDLRRVHFRPMHNGLSDAAFAFLANNSELTNLNFEGANALTDEVLTHIAGLKKLDYLAIQYADSFTGKGLDKIAGASSITNLEFLASGITDEGMKAISTFKKLQAVRLTSPKITAAGFAALTHLKTLVTLTLNGSTFDDEAASVIVTMPNLTNLDLSSTKITDAGLVKLKSLKKLTSLSLAGTTVTLEAAAEFQKTMPQCRVNR
ncbi:protein kinase [Prosthecobacter sp.]|uniref:protein kinase domain-containing protein n=1 Tax=Prosthecobacter sp. TaxID=1965333 RepID=UPI002ABBA460|nr:protein kinase [Prosthecobacter sp.]MDZ4402556.1 protein kinase [Prosthecobacter sp.]